MREIPLGSPRGRRDAITHSSRAKGSRTSNTEPGTTFIGQRGTSFRPAHKPCGGRFLSSLYSEDVRFRVRYPCLMNTILFSLFFLACGIQQPADQASAPDGKVDDASPSISLKAPADVAGPPADATTTESGLAYKVLKAGSGTRHPTATTEVEVHYTGWQTNGTMFDSSVKKGKSISFPLNRVIAGWTEGVQLMVKGEKTRFWIPEELAYKGRKGAPSGMLVFDIELVDIVPSMTERFPAPENVASPPADAKRTATGLAYKVIKAGTGSSHPTGTTKVSVHYTGWQTDGTTFDSSHKRGRPATFPLNGVIAGWTEGVQLMVQGEVTRFWIPEDLAYKGRKGRPSGMLVFDIELLEIK